MMMKMKMMKMVMERAQQHRGAFAMRIASSDGGPRRVAAGGAQPRAERL